MMLFVSMGFDNLMYKAFSSAMSIILFCYYFLHKNAHFKFKCTIAAFNVQHFGAKVVHVVLTSTDTALSFLNRLGGHGHKFAALDDSFKLLGHRMLHKIFSLQ